jgi:molybdenum cofactor cytidylyltransferase
MMAKLGAVVLAAGASRRFGPDNKLLADMGGEPLVRRVVKVAASCGISHVVVVTGHDRHAVEQSLRDVPAVRFASNPNWELGMGSSIAIGVSALAEAVEGAFIVPGDMGLLSPALLDQLAAAFDEEGRESIVVPVTTEGAQRNPILWPRRYFSALTALDGAEGGKSVLASLAASWRALTVADETEFADVDTPSDLALVRKRIDKRSRD